MTCEQDLAALVPARRLSRSASAIIHGCDGIIPTYGEGGEAAGCIESVLLLW